jgi:hypothetical protein
MWDNRWPGDLFGIDRARAVFAIISVACLRSPAARGYEVTSIDMSSDADGGNAIRL